MALLSWADLMGSGILVRLGDACRAQSDHSPASPGELRLAAGTRSQTAARQSGELAAPKAAEAGDHAQR
jgi:hypothetical protein